MNTRPFFGILMPVCSGAAFLSAFRSGFMDAEWDNTQGKREKP
jgi:hypothetical protein